jgi:hypothetical protein
LLHGKTQLGLEFQEGKKEVNAQSDPDLSKYRVMRCAKERFDFQVLLDPFEKEFDLPAFLVEISDGLGIQVIGIGDITVLLAGFRIDVTDDTQRLWDVTEQNGAINGNAFCLATGTLAQVLDLGIAFETSDEIDAVSCRKRPWTQAATLTS